MTVDDELGNLKVADATEMQLIEQMGRMGQELLHAWTSGQALKAAQSVAQDERTWGAELNSNGSAPLGKSQQ